MTWTAVSARPQPPGVTGAGVTARKGDGYGLTSVHLTVCSECTGVPAHTRRSPLPSLGQSLPHCWITVYLAEVGDGRGLISFRDHRLNLCNVRRWCKPNDYVHYVIKAHTIALNVGPNR
jgi:hypothetical protein